LIIFNGSKTPVSSKVELMSDGESISISREIFDLRYLFHHMALVQKAPTPRVEVSICVVDVNI
jgi:hypothetical protein